MASRPSPDVIYAELSAEDNSTEIESLCTQCWENGKTRIMLTKIPYFKEVILMSFSCPHCGFNNNEIQPGAPLQDKGCRIELKVERAEDLNRQIIKSEHATFKILENEFEIPPTTQRGISSTTEGMIAQAAANLEKDQPVRQHIDLDTTGKIQGVIDTLKAMAAGQQLPFTVVLDDPAGNSPSNATHSQSDGHTTMCHSSNVVRPQRFSPDQKKAPRRSWHSCAIGW